MAREALSRLLNADPPEHIVFTQNATDALNILIQGFLSEKKEAAMSSPQRLTIIQC